uniref:Uncharacterized protein n=1 Tax=Rhizophora mucronata TaxID=61149 RepID=A0A2P2JUA6_RHIMU
MPFSQKWKLGFTWKMRSKQIA